MDGELVTKHCTPDVLAHLLTGHFRIGTTAAYASVEVGGRFSDAGEGRGAIELIGDHRGVSIPGLGLENFTAVGNGGGAIRINVPANFYAFCASNGEYSASRHRSLLDGTDSYEANEGMTAYVVLRKRSLSDALYAAIAKVTASRVALIGRSVAYGVREITYSDAIAFSRDLSLEGSWAAAYRAAFVKPPKFQVEEEFRYLGVVERNTPPAKIDTVELGAEIAALFRNAIVSHGTFQPT